MEAEPPECKTLLSIEPPTSGRNKPYSLTQSTRQGDNARWRSLG
jgi:hypothetical protein